MNSQLLKERFLQVASTLEKKPWFKKDNCEASVHEFPNAKNPEGVTFQVSKNHWFNDDGRGIHIESYLDLRPAKQKRTYITLHVLHHPTIPGTKLKRMVISKPFIDAIYDEVSSWPGYKFRAGKYGQQPFTKILNGSSADFENTLGEEVTSPL